MVREVKIYNTGETLKIEDKMDCRTRGFLYLVWSQKAPRVQYLGQSGQRVADRLLQHRRDVMDNRKGRAVVEHFCRLRSKVDDFRFMPFLKICDDDPLVIQRLERYYINKYNLVASGINSIL